MSEKQQEANQTQPRAEHTVNPEPILDKTVPQASSLRGSAAPNEEIFAPVFLALRATEGRQEKDVVSFIRPEAVPNPNVEAPGFVALSNERASDDTVEFIQGKEHNEESKQDP